MVSQSFPQTSRGQRAVQAWEVDPARRLHAGSLRVEGVRPSRSRRGLGLRLRGAAARPPPFPGAPTGSLGLSSSPEPKGPPDTLTLGVGGRRRAEEAGHALWRCFQALRRGPQDACARAGSGLVRPRTGLGSAGLARCPGAAERGGHRADCESPAHSDRVEEPAYGQRTQRHAAERAAEEEAGH